MTIRLAAIFFLFALFSVATPLQAKKTPPPTEIQTITPGPDLQTLYTSLDPLSLSQNFAFYELYPDSELGKAALQRIWSHLCGEQKDIPPLSVFPRFDVQAIISLVTRQPTDAPITLTEEQIQTLESISSRLGNRKLKGFSLWEEKDLRFLPPEEVDLSRALLIHQFAGDADAKRKIREYEATMDMMAMQILLRLPPNCSGEEKVKEINRFIFQDMGFRFPPHSLHAKNIDLYTFLPSVLDSRQGVCLGVSILYLSLAQRLDLPLEILTPPGHIFISYKDSLKTINIETTARGINLPEDVYLGVNTKTITRRNIKEVIGLSFMNGASVSLGNQDYKGSLELYEKAIIYLPEDPLLKMLLGMNYLFTGQTTKGKKLLKEIEGVCFEGAISPESMPEDFLKGNIDIDGIKAVFLPVDENRTSILEKQEQLKKITKKYPRFRAGLLQYATSYLQLGRTQEALNILLGYHRLDPTSPIVEYYLAILCMERLDFNKAWTFLQQAEKLSYDKDHHPKALQSVRQSLRRVCPYPSAS